jgi:hypothetical protein
MSAASTRRRAAGWPPAARGAPMSQSIHFGSYCFLTADIDLFPFYRVSSGPTVTAHRAPISKPVPSGIMRAAVIRSMPERWPAGGRLPAAHRALAGQGSRALPGRGQLRGTRVVALSKSNRCAWRLAVAPAGGGSGGGSAGRQSKYARALGPSVNLSCPCPCPCPCPQGRQRRRAPR